MIETPVPARKPPGSARVADDPAVAIPVGVLANLHHREGVLDWRTLDPESIRGDGIPVEELRYYQEKLDALSPAGEGRYVLIVGRDVFPLFDDLDTAARYSWEHYRGRAVLIKKIAAVEPVRSHGPSARSGRWPGSSC